MKILHVITDLDNGGAESILYRLIKQTPEFEHEVISLMDQGIYGELINQLGVNVKTINLKKNIFDLFKLFNLFFIIAKSNCNCVQTWMYHSDLFAGIFSKLAFKKNIFWGIHASYNKSNTKFTTKLIIYVNSILSFFIPKKIVNVSTYSIDIHKKLGFCISKFILINNGYSNNDFKYNSLAKKNVLTEFNIQEDQIIFGMVARYDPFKDHLNLLKALSLLKNKYDKFICLLIGPNMDSNNDIICSIINDFNLSKNIILVGPKNNISDYLSALDFHVLSSIDESFPNVISESMLCSTPCISTDVGDASFIIDRYGWIVPKSDSLALSSCLIEVINFYINRPEEWIELKKRCRMRIEQNFSIEKMAINYSLLWKSN
jgi:glycosyltransferase involved in cell wall biosynthesis